MLRGSVEFAPWGGLLVADLACGDIRLEVILAADRISAYTAQHRKLADMR